MRTFVLTVLVFATMSIFAQNIKVKYIEKSLVKISDNAYVSKYDVSNEMYMQFLSDLKNNGKTDLYATCYPDTTKWHTKFAYNEPFVTLYHAHPAYFNYPTVNIDKKSAEEFCKWLTTKYNDGKKHKFENIEFRLPTEAEWKTFASKCKEVAKRTGEELGPHDNTPMTIGNVSEMTSDGTALGSNWAEKDIQMPSPWVGFRIVGEVSQQKH
jgi:hypothetical protein